MIVHQGAFSKFTLKPSALSQHTANFNKLLEQVPAPKIDSLQLLKPHEPILNERSLNTSTTTSTINNTNNAKIEASTSE